MALIHKAVSQPVQTGTVHDQVKWDSRGLPNMQSLIRKLMSMLLAMGAGTILFCLLVFLMRASSSNGTLLEPGTDLYAIGMAVFMTVPTWLVTQCGDRDRNARASGSC